MTNDLTLMPGQTTFTGNGISLFRLASLKGMVKLDKLGMRHSGGPIRPRIAAEFGLKPRDSHDKFIAAIEAKIAALEIQPGEVTA
jgi:hypothetical protein